MKVTKEVTFDSAHMLSNYVGKCHNLHGHTYKLQVTLEGCIRLDGNDTGMVMDFNDLKVHIDRVIQPLDHAIIFSDASFRFGAENALLEWAEKYSMKYVVIPQSKSTSEMIAAYVKESLIQVIENPDVSVSVRLWETPTSFVEV